MRFLIAIGHTFNIPSSDEIHTFEFKMRGKNVQFGVKQLLIYRYSLKPEVHAVFELDLVSRPNLYPIALQRNSRGVEDPYDQKQFV